ncbi:hypothetical protein EYB25_003626 [Talaromyces marneffei]|nr:hypothetical protein EYB25_003626 [Talaromyces marneffei]
MDLRPAPLSVKKRKSLPAVKLGNERPQKPLIIFGRSTSARVSTRISSGESTVLASNSPPQLTEWPNLDVPKIRRSNTSKSHGRPSKKGGPDAAHPKKPTGILHSTSSTLKDEDQRQGQKAIRNESQTQGRMSQFLHALDKKLIKPSAREISKRLPNNVRSIQIEDTLHSSLKKAEVYAHITITVDVSLESVQYIPYSLAITTVILLNMTSDREMVRVTTMAQVILNKLQGRDAVVVACVNFERNDCIDVLFSTSENCDFDLARLLSDCTSAGKQLINGAFRDDELLGVAVDNSFQLFGSNSPSQPHVFLVSANRDIALNTTFNAAVGLTTVTLEDHYEFGPTPRPGWHIYSGLDLGQSSSFDFQHKVEKALCHIRSGFSSGNITDLNVRFALASGYEIQVCGRTSIASLRPGEVWKLLVRVNMSGEQDSNRLEREIKSMLRCRDIAGLDFDRGESILVATLRFNHSLQPGCSLKMVKSCSIVPE